MADITGVGDDKFSKIHYNDYTPTSLTDALNNLNHQLDEFKKGNYVQNVGDDLDATRKAGFYLDWAVRYRKLFSFSFLGQKGVIAIPNTTFEEWLYWFHELFAKFIDDYNAFKKLTFEAIDGLQKEIDAIKAELEKIENEINHILDMIKSLRDALNALSEKEQRDVDNLQSQVTNLRNLVEQYHTELKNDISNLQNQLNDLKNRVGDIERRLSSNMSPQWRDVDLIADDGTKTSTGWYRNPNGRPNGLSLRFRWLDNEKHELGLYYVFNFNRIVNDNFNWNENRKIVTFSNAKFKEATGRDFPENFHWYATAGSYWNSAGRYSLGYRVERENNNLNVYIDWLGGPNDKPTGRYEIAGISEESFLA